MRARALFTAEICAGGTGEIPPMGEYAREAVAVSRSIADDEVLALAQALGAGILAGATWIDQFDRADGATRMRALSEEAIRVGEGTGNRWVARSGAGQEVDKNVDDVPERGRGSTATTIAAIPATTKTTSGQMPTRRLTRRETPFASTRISPTFSRVTNVDDMPARLRSRNSTRLKCVPTATISSAPFSYASSSAMSSLIPGAGTRW